MVLLVLLREVAGETCVLVGGDEVAAPQLPPDR